MTSRDNYNFVGMAGQNVRGYMCLPRHVFKMAGHVYILLSTNSPLDFALTIFKCPIALMNLASCCSITIDVFTLVVLVVVRSPTCAYSIYSIREGRAKLDLHVFYL